MKHVMMASVCGLASAAAAQSASLSIVSSVATFDGTVSTIFTLSVYADADFGTHIAGGEFALAGIADASQAVDMVGSAPAWAGLGENDRGYAGNGDYAGLVFGQLIFPPFLPPSAESALAGGPVLVGSVMVTMPANSGGYFGWDLVAGPGDFVLEVYDEADGSFTQLTDVEFGSVVVSIPSAPSGALLVIAGLAGVRRRR